MFDVLSVRFPVLSSDPCLVFFCLSFVCLLPVCCSCSLACLAQSGTLFHHAADLWAGGASHGGRDVLAQHPPRPPNITLC